MWCCILICDYYYTARQLLPRFELENFCLQECYNLTTDVQSSIKFKPMKRNLQLKKKEEKDVHFWRLRFYIALIPF